MVDDNLPAPTDMAGNDTPRPKPNQYPKETSPAIAPTFTQALHEHVPTKPSLFRPAQNHVQWNKHILTADRAIHESDRERVVPSPNIKAGMVARQQSNRDSWSRGLVLASAKRGYSPTFLAGQIVFLEQIVWIFQLKGLLPFVT